jgi:ABC-2 type transport system ATP-binding protein
MPATDPPAVIETRELTKVYPGRVTALDGLTVDFAPGVTGLVGANGAGKSTLIKILLGLIGPTKGQAKVLGQDCETSGEKIRSLLGYMPEHDCLPADVTATEFVTHLGRISGLPPTVAKERAAESLRHVGLHEERYRLIGTYSTGMKQRVKLAQALVGAPRLLLLDEPTNGLDPAGRTAMLELIARIGAEFGISIVVAAPARRDRADLRSSGRDRRRTAAARRYDHQLHPGQSGPRGRGRGRPGPAAGGAGRPRTRRHHPGQDPAGAARRR